MGRRASATAATSIDESLAAGIPGPTLGYRERFRADLRQDCLPEMLYKIYTHRVGGVLEAILEGTTKRLFFRDGYVTYAASSHRSDSLWAYLLRERIVPLDILREVANERASSNRKFGVLLLERGLLSPERLNEAIRGQVEQVAWSLFEWDEGQVDFEFREMQEDNPIRIQIPLPRLVLKGIRRASNPQRWMRHLGDGGTVLISTATSDRLIELGIGEEEYQQLRLVDGERTLLELCELGPLTPAENGRILYALQVLELVRPLPE